MKRNCILPVLLIVFSVVLYADEFTDILQDLAVQTACIGKYSATQAGGGWRDDPHDYYTPEMMAERFKAMSGSMTRTATFYGVCFDYAQAAYEDIQKYRSSYNKAGMYESCFWIAGVDANSNVITLTRPTNYDNADIRVNGVYVRKMSTEYVKTHEITGTRATNHAWLWIQRNDGVMFWIDPTWTDNIGYVVWGYVINGEEIQLRPDERFCVQYPEYLKDLPFPPAVGQKLKPSSANGSHIASSGPSSNSDTENCYGDIISCGIIIPFSNMFQNADIGFSFSYENGTSYRFPLILQIDCYGHRGKGFLLFDLGAGLQLGQIFALYGGGGIGCSKDIITLFDSKSSDFYKVDFAWKVNAGIRTAFGSSSLRYDVSYINGAGFLFGLFIGYVF